MAEKLEAEIFYEIGDFSIRLRNDGSLKIILPAIRRKSIAIRPETDNSIHVVAVK